MAAHAVANMAHHVSSRGSVMTRSSVTTTTTTTTTTATPGGGVTSSGRKINTLKMPRRVGRSYPGGRSAGGRRGGTAGAVAMPVVEARLSGFSGPRVTNTQRPDVSLVGSVLKACQPGDLMAVRLTPGDGEGHLASGEDIAEDVWFVVKNISTSSGGRHMVEGEMFGLKVQIIDQPSGGGRLGVTGVAVDTTVPWLSKFPGWEQHLVKQAQVEPLLKSAVIRAKIVSSLSTLESCVAANPGHWTSGEVSSKRRAIITDPIERATQSAGELMALLTGEREVVMTQLWAGWVDPGQQPVGAPWVSQLLQKIAEAEDDFGVEMSVSDDEEGHPGITAVIYNKRTAAEDDKKQGEANALAAKTIAKLGSQADCSAVTPYERVLVGLALGYDERDVAYHLDKLGSPFSASLFIRAREVLLS